MTRLQPCKSRAYDDVQKHFTITDIRRSADLGRFHIGPEIASNACVLTAGPDGDSPTLTDLVNAKFPPNKNVIMMALPVPETLRGRYNQSAAALSRDFEAGRDKILGPSSTARQQLYTYLCPCREWETGLSNPRKHTDMTDFVADIYYNTANNIHINKTLRLIGKYKKIEQQTIYNLHPDAARWTLGVHLLPQSAQTSFAAAADAEIYTPRPPDENHLVAVKWAGHGHCSGVALHKANPVADDVPLPNLLIMRP